MKTKFKEFVLRMPLELYEACKDLQHIERKPSFADFIRDTLKSYVEYKGYILEPKLKLEPESFFEKPSETISEMLNSVKQVGPTPGAWDDLPKWDKD